MSKGIVYIVGAGPGDPELITIKGMKILKEADVILYDRLVSKELLQSIPNNVEKIYVGREVGTDFRHQEEINKLMLKFAMEGKKVVRLKGGDPFIFGRGGEEIEFLKEHGIKFEVIPGVSSFIAATASALIPLTHRRYSSSFVVVTGHEDPTKEESNVRWEEIAKAVDTIVIFMGIGNLENIIRRLMNGGIREDTPIAIIRSVTTKDEKIIYSNLSNIISKVKEEGIDPPAIIIIGKVVNIGKRLKDEVSDN